MVCQQGDGTAGVTIYTIGHSTRALDDFLALLAAHDIRQLADVRTIPKSRRHPHFAGDLLSASLHEAGIEYCHFAALGGLRKPRADSSNTGWRHQGFRGYADYMRTAPVRSSRSISGITSDRRTSVRARRASRISSSI